MPEYGTAQWDGYISAKLAKLFFWMDDFTTASSLADRAFKFSQDPFIYEVGYVEAIRLQGDLSLKLNDFPIADERLHHALTRARKVNLIEEELPALIGLAELRLRQGDMSAAREFLDDVWEVAERGPYPLFHANACNILAQIERDEGKQDEAVKAATKAYELSWCDGPPFAYHWGLVAARKHLQELGADEPLMTPFDASKFEPMPEVEIDPEDEFHAGKVGEKSS
jgi:tetratricopeptide (TPR) repeat protein